MGDQFHLLVPSKRKPTGRFYDGRELYIKVYKCVNCGTTVEVLPEQWKTFDYKQVPGCDNKRRDT